MQADIYNKNRLLIILCPPFWNKVPPLNLVYLYNYLKKKKIHTQVIDLNIYLFNKLKKYQNIWLKLNTKFEKILFDEIFKLGLLNDLIEKINQNDYEYIGFSVFDRNKYFVRELIKRIRNKKIILGGPYILKEIECNLNFFEKRENFYYVIGEGEKPLEKILKRQINQIYKYDQIKDLDTLPFIDYDCLGLNEYKSNFLPVLASRGCIKKCRFCTENMLYKGIRYNSPEYLIEQIIYLIKKYKRKNFVFHDSLINFNIDWLENFCDLVIKNNLEIKWEAQCVIRKDMSAEIFKKMKKAGCYNLFIGLESGSGKILENMRKGYTTHQAIKFFRELNKANLHFEISLILNFLEESQETIKETLNFLKENKNIIPKIAQVNPFIPDELLDINIKDYKIDYQILEKIKQFFREQNIRFTNSFIGNLVSSDIK